MRTRTNDEVGQIKDEVIRAVKEIFTRHGTTIGSYINLSNQLSVSTPAYRNEAGAQAMIEVVVQEKEVKTWNQRLAVEMADADAHEHLNEH